MFLKWVPATLLFSSLAFGLSFQLDNRTASRLRASSEGGFCSICQLTNQADFAGGRSKAGVDPNVQLGSDTHSSGEIAEESVASVDRLLRITIKNWISNQPYSVDVNAKAEQERGNSQSLCLRGVKKHIYATGRVPRGSLDSVEAARDIDRPLKSLRFIDLTAPGGLMANNHSPCAAPVGAIIVYTGGHAFRCHSRTNPCGHVEIRTRTGFSSDYHSDHPVTETSNSRGQCRAENNGYRVKSILIPPLHILQAAEARRR